MHILRTPFIALLSLAMSGIAPGQAPPSAAPRMHDPSTIVRDGGLFYVYSTGKGIPFFSSPNAHTWTRRGSVFSALPQTVVQFAPGNDGIDAWAPDILKIGDTFYLYYAVSKWSSFASAVGLATNKTLNPDDLAYHWIDRGMVVHSDGQENLNAIDPGAILTPDGQLWLCYGSYHGTIDLVQLDPKTGMRLQPDSPVTHIAGGSEASDLIAHGGWFYLFVNHGSCCQGANSRYHINVGRSHSMTGPYVDRQGHPLTEVPGEAFIATEGEHIGPGHFGLFPGKPERFSLHYESDPAAQGKSALAVRFLTWSADGWPIAGALDPQ